MIFQKITKKIWLEMVIFHFFTTEHFKSLNLGPVYMEVGDHR